ncbi:PREDICTED: uncharacterized protein LOC104708771 [Camelina sativa]|uniref:Uncharacterized protein LOC104708771 n=1 Tax=Camelina sativa TaxID=90675 RepID=A0ABM1QCQ8_CAMSA|nr:PREDICTED: uncharacterized protein LOC104708771 [Camelina sativa]XP_019084546.1 PREDICTED: uncharacterized protein LOC104708771 [Camelina sativa]
MDGSADEGRHKFLPKVSEYGRVTVSGYNIRLTPLADVERALREHFTPCGEITDVCCLRRIGYIYFMGEGAVDKAMQLNGSDVEGWNVAVEPFPFPEHANDSVVVRVEGYDTSLSKIDIQSALSNLFSSYGEIQCLIILEGYAQVSVEGKDIADKALELNGSVMGGRKLAIEVLCRPYLPTTHMRRRYRWPLPGLQPYPDSSTSDAVIPQSRSESSKTPDKPVEKKRKLSKEEATATLKSKTIPTLVEKQTPDLAGLVVYDICMGDGKKKADPGKWVTVH